MAALHKLGTQCFGILMRFEPAIATFLGLLIPGEVPGPQQVAGMVCVILASAGAVKFLDRKTETA